MKIKYYNMSLIGTIHKSINSICQDANSVKVMDNGWIVAAIADGLGSKKLSYVGASLAVESVTEFVERNCPKEWKKDKLTSILCEAYKYAFSTIMKSAVADCEFIDSYDTTLTTVIYDGDNCVYGHVGDSGIISISPYEKISLVTQRQRGERFNQTVPLRAGKKMWKFGFLDNDISGLIMMTDGLLDIACPWENENSRNINMNFVAKLMNRELQGSVAWEEIKDRAESFLLSEACDIISDDKTIVVLIKD